MKATGIVRRIDDLGRVVIPKEIRRTMRIREGDPLEIYTSRDGEVVFKKYSLLGGLDEFAAQFCETLSKSTGSIVAVTDRDSVIAVAGGGRRELMGKRITADLEQIMEDRRIYQYTGEDRRFPVCDSSDKLTAAVAAPILSEGDVLGLVLPVALMGLGVVLFARGMGLALGVFGAWLALLQPGMTCQGGKHDVKYSYYHM